MRTLTDAFQYYRGVNPKPIADYLASLDLDAQYLIDTLQLGLADKTFHEQLETRQNTKGRQQES